MDLKIKKKLFLESTKNKWEFHAVLNPTVIKEKDIEHLIYRGVGHNNISCLGYAKIKDGKIIEGRIVQVRGIFVRVLDNYDSPFKEFPIEDVAHIELSNPEEVSPLTIKNIRERTLDTVQSRKIQDVLDKRAEELFKETPQSPETGFLEKSSDEVETVVPESANTVIEESVKTVEASSSQKASDSVQEAAKQPTILVIGDTGIDANNQDKGWWFFSGLTVKDQIAGGLLILLLVLLYREKRRKSEAVTGSDMTLTSSLKQIDEELKKLDPSAEGDGATEEKKEQWEEKREYKRVQWNFPVSLRLDDSNPVLAMVKDISPGGAYAVCNDANLLRTLGDRSKFKFTFASRDQNFLIKGKVEVVRIKSNRGLGMKFFELDQGSTSYLHSLS